MPIDQATGDVQRTIFTMLQSKRNASIEGSCCRLLEEFACRGPESVKQILDATGVTAIARVLYRHPTNAVVRKSAIKALCAICTHGDARVVGYMRAPLSRAVRGRSRSALAALRGIVTNSESWNADEGELRVLASSCLMAAAAHRVHGAPEASKIPAHIHTSPRMPVTLSKRLEALAKPKELGATARDHRGGGGGGGNNDSGEDDVPEFDYGLSDDDEEEKRSTKAKSGLPSSSSSSARRRRRKPTTRPVSPVREFASPKAFEPRKPHPSFGAIAPVSSRGDAMRVLDASAARTAVLEYHRARQGKARQHQDAQELQDARLEAAAAAAETAAAAEEEEG